VVDAAQRKADRSYAWGPLSVLGLTVGVITCVIDQAAKLWLLDAFDLAGRGQVAVTPFLDLLLTWNTGISYGLLQQEGAVGQWALLAFKAAAVVFLWIWLARAPSRLTAAALGLIIGGAIGNAIDRLHWPGVMDFVLFHIDTASWSFHWYVFNLADVAIVAGVVGLLYESLRAGAPQKRPDRG
jgi:signal peptidase II